VRRANLLNDLTPHCSGTSKGKVRNPQQICGSKTNINLQPDARVSWARRVAGRPFDCHAGSSPPFGPTMKIYDDV
jgi:hypothetical protein